MGIGKPVVPPRVMVEQVGDRKGDDLPRQRYQSKPSKQKRTPGLQKLISGEWWLVAEDCVPTERHPTHWGEILLPDGQYRELWGWIRETPEGTVYLHGRVGQLVKKYKPSQV